MRRIMFILLLTPSFYQPAWAACGGSGFIAKVAESLGLRARTTVAEQVTRLTRDGKRVVLDVSQLSKNGSSYIKENPELARHWQALDFDLMKFPGIDNQHALVRTDVKLMGEEHFTQSLMRQESLAKNGGEILNPPENGFRIWYGISKKGSRVTGMDLTGDFKFKKFTKTERGMLDEERTLRSMNAHRARLMMQFKQAKVIAERETGETLEISFVDDAARYNVRAENVPATRGGFRFVEAFRELATTTFAEVTATAKRVASYRHQSGQPVQPLASAHGEMAQALGAIKNRPLTTHIESLGELDAKLVVSQKDAKFQFFIRSRGDGPEMESKLFLRRVFDAVNAARHQRGETRLIYQTVDSGNTLTVADYNISLVGDAASRTTVLSVGTSIEQRALMRDFYNALTEVADLRVH